MPSDKNINMLARMRDARLKKLAGVKPFIIGTVVEYEKVCGNPDCKCTRGDKHKAQHLTYKDENQKTVSVYIPADMLAEVKRWTEEYKILKDLLQQISDLQRNILRRHVAEKRLKKGRP
jgi:hypothetical protein